MTSEELEVERFRVDRERLEIEKTRAASDQKFLNRNLGTVITAVVSLAAILVSLGQVWVAKISKDREISMMQSQKDNEIAIMRLQHEREWNLSMAKFVSENAAVIFGKNPEQRERIAKVIVATFPTNITEPLFQKLESLPSTMEEQDAWRTARQTLPKVREQPRLLPVPEPEPRTEPKPAQVSQADYDLVQNLYVAGRGTTGKETTDCAVIRRLADSLKTFFSNTNLVPEDKRYSVLYPRKKELPTIGDLARDRYLRITTMSKKNCFAS